ncbi:Alpha/Beta hydrolase protein [Leucosporidium creatinivorum]|uniref:Alpha/Beta hydrolase protein n=1 Tax=Leucosporidium creatinivorum TaxID=106004 RepID=A0A1Y2E2S4_9BASI|nr:Alpha/Beta hydrolase protein [Leucosporidium creatinivorum]
MVPFSNTIKRAHTILFCVGGAYAAFLVALSLPAVQRSLVFLHQIRYPWTAEFDAPETLGFAPGKVRNFYLDTQDDCKLGTWHVLPNSAYDKASKLGTGVPIEGPFAESVFDAALRDYPTVLYFHGNAATRGAPNRVRVARHMSDEEHNFIIVDYRGFADSTGTPSEEGLLTDARRVWDYLTLEKSVPASRITIMGQSLGTGVSAGLAGRLAKDNLSPKGLILVAPFSSVGALLETYKLFNTIPILSPLKSIPWMMKAFLNLLHTKFDTKGVIHTITCPILILHAQDDPVIPHLHSSALAHHLLDPLLPSLEEEAEVRALARASIVTEAQVGRWGVVTRFERGKGVGAVVWAEAVRGEHNDIGTSEYSLKLISEQLHTV